MTVCTVLVSLVCLKLLAREFRPDPVQAVLEKIASLDPALQSKFCAHRANNVLKYRAARELFDCVELDVVIDPPTGDSAAVYHPPVENHIGLSLEFLLQHEALPEGHLWLDVKDVSASNWKGFLKDLNALIPPTRRRDVIIETGWHGQGVSDLTTAFSESGYLISYYLPTDPAIECQNMRSDRCDALRDSVLRSVALGFSHLSFDARAYPFVLTMRDSLPPSIRLLTWDITPAWPRMDLIENVDVYIIRFPHRFSN